MFEIIFDRDSLSNRIYKILEVMKNIDKERHGRVPSNILLLIQVN